MAQRFSNRKFLLILATLALLMLGAAYAFVPLYNLFCKLVGIPTATIVVGPEGLPKSTDEISDRVVTVRFVGQSADGVPVEFAPELRRLDVRLGEPALVAYQARNTTEKALTGVAIHTIVAQASSGDVDDVAEHVDLQQCFCFEEQVYPAQQQVHLPLSFTVMPTLPENIHTVTFGYTLYQQPE